MTGIIYLIGAGPGDYKLITVKGRECIEKADVIIYDYLADSKILRWARPDAELIYAGKKCKDHTLHQYEINDLLVKYGQEGKIVARLKGGDPLIFGRGGEEALALKKAGVPFEFVPGVTSGIAAPAYAGIPVTQRAMATSFAIVTGHEDPTKDESGINWQGLATAVDTISFVMGVGHLPTISQNLIKYGRSKDTPVAVIRWGTKAEQFTLVSTLENVADDVAKANIKPPAIITVGKVVGLREDLRWFDNKPLFGKTIVVTRARSQASALTERLETLGANVLETPAIKTLPLSITEAEKTMIKDVAGYDVVAFTSAQGVKYFFENLAKQDLDARALGHAKICAIGSATAKALTQYGLLADIVPANYQGEEVVKAVVAWQSGKAGIKAIADTKILLVQPKEARAVIPNGLVEAGFKVDVVRLYETVQADEGTEILQEALALGTVDYITFTSSSTVTNTIKMLGDDALALIGNTKVVCIGPITAATCVENNITPHLVGETFTIPDMVNLIQQDVAK